MQDPTAELNYLQAARCEDLQYNEIKTLTVLGEYEKNIVERLKQPGSHLLQGARGVGKSMLLRQVEIELDDNFEAERNLAVYVNFKTSPVLEGVKVHEKEAFQIWVSAKILQALHKKLLSLDLVRETDSNDPYHKIFGIEAEDKIQDFLSEKIHKIQVLALAKENEKEKDIDDIGDDFINKVNDINFLERILGEVIEKFKISRLIFLFDEVAHTFIPSQQEIFFEIFKLLHGDKIAVKAAVYPSVTSYGKNFEIGQDAILVPLDRFETGTAGLNEVRKLFREILQKRIPEDETGLRKRIFSRAELLDQCIYMASGNPRAFFHILLKAVEKNFNEYGVLGATQEYVDQELLPYHTQLAKRIPKYSKHVTIGLDLVRQYIVPEIRLKNNRSKLSGYQSAFFTIDRDATPNLKIALDILSYSGVLNKKGTVKIANKKTGQRYMVHLALMVTEKAFSASKILDNIKTLSITDYREFSSADPKIELYANDLRQASELCQGCSTELPLGARFCHNCGDPVVQTGLISLLLDDSVENLSISEKMCIRIKGEYAKVGDIIQATKDDLMQIKFVGEVRSRLIKNAADEYISG